MVGAKTSSTSNHFGGVNPFEIQVKFGIPLIQGYIDANYLEKWLNLLEGCNFVQIFSIAKISPRHSLSTSPMSNIGRTITSIGMPIMSLKYTR